MIHDRPTNDTLRFSSTTFRACVSMRCMTQHKRSLVSIDPWLKSIAPVLADRATYVEAKSKHVLSDTSVDQFALGHLYYGLHRTAKGWVLREWAPNATKMFLVCSANDWHDDPSYALTRRGVGDWEVTLPADALTHGMHYKLHIYWRTGDGFRIPSYATYVVQDPMTHVFDAVVWSPPKPFPWTDSRFIPSNTPPLIYEAHVGMSSEKPEVATYKYFTTHVLPRIKKAGYNTIQLMAIQEHPYYGSFGYHVSNFFAASSRFGTPHDLKKLINTAHTLGIAVILDIVHSHSVKNEEEGLSRFAGDPAQYFYPGERGEHVAWDSRLFDYGKGHVLHFLLSNVRYWLDEYHLDGFRFDGVTSMLYTDHGLQKEFAEYADYADGNVDKDGLVYLTLANRLVHAVKPTAITVAEEMSGYPGLAGSNDFMEGIGFDYRLSMGVPDLWIKTLKEHRDEDWGLGHLYHELTTHRAEEKTIAYAESHDQALVGDKTLIFRLIDKAMYHHMSKDDPDLAVERGLALHKLIRLLTASLHNGGYLNFMGNEFGHPEWIDFPREGNDWSYTYARRQWSLVDSKKLKYQWLGAFDTAMLGVIKNLSSEPRYVTIHEDKHTLSFERDGYVFAFNLSPVESYTQLAVPAPAGAYRIVLDADNPTFGGQGRIDDFLTYETTKAKQGDKLTLYLPARTAIVLQPKH